MRRFYLAGFLGAVLLLLVSACGDERIALDLMEWPHMEKAVPLKVNGQAYNAYIASNETHRRRARQGLAVHSNEVIAYQFPASKEAVEFELGGVTEAVELVFVGEGSKVLQVQKVEPFVNRTFPTKFAVKDTRLILQMPAGSAEKLQLSEGKDVTTDPDLVKSADKASGEFTQVHFVTDTKPDVKPGETPSINVKFLEKAEEVSQGMKDRPDFKDGEGIMIAYGGTGQFVDFWLKEVEGPVCACFIERQGRRGDTVTSILSMYEDLKAEGDRDIDRPVFSAPDQASYLVIFKGKDFFTKNNIQPRARIVVTGNQQYDHTEPKWDDLPVKFAKGTLSTRLATSEAERTAALLAAPGLEKNKGLVFNFDDPSFVEFNPAGMAGEARLLFVSGDGTGKYSIREQRLNSKSAPIKAGDAKDGRFVIAVPKDFDTAGFEMPYSLRDLRPSTQALAFYSGKSEVVNDRWPKDAKARARVELALSATEHSKGLMFRESLKSNHGMLFVYKDEQDDMSYWMKNCKMDLPIAFVDRKGVIIKIHNRMKAPQAGVPDHLLEQYKADGPARFAIEMDADWFDKNKIEVGDRVFIPARFTTTE